MRLRIVAAAAVLAANVVSTVPARAVTDVAVVTMQMTLVDEARDRTLETTISYPVDRGEAVPLIVLAHGNSGNPSNFTQLMGAWAAAGYVVAAPAFPAGNPGDLRGQVGDMSFVIDEVLKMSRAKAGPLAGLVDARHIGAAGLSLGGGTVYGLMFNTCCRDTRVDAVVLMSTLRVILKGGKEKFPHLPTMMIAGDADPVSRVTVNTYPLLATPKWKVMLHGGTHSDPYEDTPDPADQIVRDITTAFWDRYLKRDKPAAQEIVDAVKRYCDAALQRDAKDESFASGCGKAPAPS